MGFPADPGGVRVAPAGAGLRRGRWAYTELNVVYHAAFSIAVPILVTDLIFPTRRHRPYLRVRGLVIAAACYLLGVALLRVFAAHAPGADPAYVAPTGHLIAAGALAVGRRL